MNEIDARQLAQLASLLGGAIPAGLVGGLTADDNRLQTGLATGAGSLGGGIGGGALGALLGGGLGAGGGYLYNQLMGGDLAENMGHGAGLGAGIGGILGGSAGSYMGAGAGHDYIQKESSAVSQQEINYAFAIGALEKMAEYGVSPAKFVEAATQSNHQGMRKIASAVIELDGAVQREKQASLRLGRRGQDAYNMINEVAHTMGGPPRAVWQGLKNLTGQPAVNNARRQVAHVWDEGGLGVDGESLEELQQLLSGAIKSRNLRVGGGVGLAGAGAAAAAYGMGDADTRQNQMRNLANNHLGTDFENTSRFDGARDQAADLSNEYLGTDFEGSSRLHQLLNG